MLDSSINYSQLGYMRIGAVAPCVQIADPHENAKILIGHYQDFLDQDCSIVLTPELSLTGYSCEDLFYGNQLRQETEKALLVIAANTGEQPLVVGAPITAPSTKQLFNCGVVCVNGTIVGAVPKSALPNHGEYYEQRWFSSGVGIHLPGRVGDHEFMISDVQTFIVGDSCRFGLEICEDLWISNPPSNRHCAHGADVILNLSASNELVTKAQYRRELVKLQSAKNLCAYVLASASCYESTKDTVYGGQLIACESGSVLAASERLSLETTRLIVDIDLQKLSYERAQATTMPGQAYRPLPASKAGSVRNLKSTVRAIDPSPFVPSDQQDLSERVRDVMKIQSIGLARRFVSTDLKRLVLGLSGGLDSTLAYLVCLQTLELLKLPKSALMAVTMPGFGTSTHTLQSASTLAKATGVELIEVDIGEMVSAHLKQLNHDGGPDVTYENAQSRERAQYLFDLANMQSALVVGTSDLSEIALGWSTYNGDHMSSYNVNVGVPKTLVRSIVQWCAKNQADPELRSVLERIIETPISPELIQSQDKGIEQQTEALLGPFEIHDFFLYHFLRTGASVEKLFYLAMFAFEGKYSKSTIKDTLTTFVGRFFKNQFKRTVLPPGPKVGTVSLSPRADWRIPDEVDTKNMLKTIALL